MSATPSPNPTNLLLLAALGIGVFWFMSRRPGGVQGTLTPIIYPTPEQNAQAYGSDSKAMKYQLIGGLLNKGFDFFSSRAAGENPYSLATGYEASSYGLSPGAGNGYLGLNADATPYNPSGNVSAFDSLYSLASR